MTTPTHTQYTTGYRWYVLCVLTLGYIFNFIDRQVMTILLEPIKAEFGATDTQMGLLTGLAFALFYATLGVPMARLADAGHLHPRGRLAHALEGALGLRAAQGESLRSCRRPRAPGGIHLILRARVAAALLPPRSARVVLQTRWLGARRC